MGLKGFWTGVKATIIASSCCTLPLILVMIFGTLGAGSMTAALKLPRYKLFFIAAGTVFMLLSLYFKIKRQCGGTCTLNDVKAHRTMVAVSIVTYVSLTLMVLYLLLPTLSAFVFG
ncbi:MAG: hypothetical protein GF416_04685 [Candidatus Altiarchaeales archaeon]|nr:hypothetical protein [Candidatus Altiarchaeales archaeon]MBD3416417.1 hypothetical protein [Candidatus Altiarchaeales archaeon]